MKHKLYIGDARRQKKDLQISLFEQEMLEPIDLHKKPPQDINTSKMPPEAFRPRILIGSTKSCPVCGENIELQPDGTVRCVKCWWWQGLAE